MRDIAHIADTFSTKGLDPQQIESISRIRFIAHECLRDQVGGPVIVSASAETELGKRVRGKERVRRKGSGKRFRKDDQLHYNEASDDDQSQFGGASIDGDQPQLLHDDREVDHLSIQPIDDEITPLQIIHAGDGGEVALLGNEDTEVEHPQLTHATGEEENVELSHATGGEEGNAVVSYEAGEEELIHAADKVDDQKLPEAHKEVDDSQLSDALKAVNDSQLSDANKDILCSQLHDLTKHVIETQQSVGTNEVCDATEDIIESQLLVASDQVDDSQLSRHNCETDPPPADEQLDVVETSSLVTREDMAQKGDCSVVV